MHQFRIFSSYALVIAFACVITWGASHPAAAQTKDTVMGGTLSSSGAAANQIRDIGDQIRDKQAFQRLIDKIQHRAPIDFSSVSTFSKRTQALHHLATTFAREIGPALPLLRTIGNNKSLTMLGKIPVAGEAAITAQTTVKAVADAGAEFQTLMALDQNYVRPVQGAIIAGNRLAKSQSPKDLPAAVDAFDKAAPALLAYINATDRQEKRLDIIASLLDTCGKKYGSSPTPLGYAARRASLAANAIRACKIPLMAMHGDVGGLLAFAQQCSGDGHAALGK